MQGPRELKGQQRYRAWKEYIALHNSSQLQALAVSLLMDANGRLRMLRSNSGGT
jgi:hypothetical protein